MKGKILLAAVGGILMVSSCKKKDDPKPIDPIVEAKAGSITFSFKNMVGNELLKLSDASMLHNTAYDSGNGDSITVSTYNYYISNIRLKTTDGKVFTEDESYHLIKESIASSKTFTIKGLPAGDYSSITFMIGVDSLHNVSGAQTGDLDPANGMFWTWRTGYIMAKFEGNVTAGPNKGTTIGYHIAGFTGNTSVLKEVTLNFPQNATVSETHTPTVNMHSDLKEWFKTPTAIDFATMSSVVDPGKEAKAIADNYADMFTVDHIDN